MAKSKQNNLAMYRQWAQNVTVGAAVLYGALWIIAGVMSKTTTMTENLGNFLLAVTVLGGISMGLLAVASSNKK